MWKIKKTMLEDLLDSSRRYYPDEFMCFLYGEKKQEEVKEFVFLPNQSGKNYASIPQSVIPIDEQIVGSVHSHPNGNIFPSSADKKFFKKYSINLIINPNGQIGFYNCKGEAIKVTIF